jgi:hypothetical protein
LFIVDICRKILKIPNGYSKSVNRRKTCNTMTKRKRTNNDPQNIHIKNKNGVTRTPLKTGGDLGCSGRVGSARRSEEK